MNKIDLFYAVAKALRDNYNGRYMEPAKIPRPRDVSVTALVSVLTTLNRIGLVELFSTSGYASKKNYRLAANCVGLDDDGLRALIEEGLRPKPPKGILAEPAAVEV